MRLLQRQADGSFSLVEHFDDMPRYAIIPQRGSDNEEVTFKDIPDGHGKDKQGYRKLVSCSQ
jgi:hypothetical protein